MKPALRAVIFDYGNTLVMIDPALHSKRTDYADVVAVPGAERMTRYLERRGLVPREEALRFIDRFLSVREANRTRADASGDEIPAIVSLRQTLREAWRPEPDDETAREALAHFFGPEEELLLEIPGAGETLAALERRRIPMALLSNATDGAYIRRVVSRFGWSALFDPLVVSTDIGVRKPRAEAFQAVLACWPFEPGEIAIVGDSLWHDVEGGNRLGLRTVHFTHIPNPLDPEHSGRILPDDSVASHEALIRVLLEAADPD